MGWNRCYSVSGAVLLRVETGRIVQAQTRKHKLETEK